MIIFTIFFLELGGKKSNIGIQCNIRKTLIEHNYLIWFYH